MAIYTEADLPVGCSLLDAAFGVVESKVAGHAVPDLVLSDVGGQAPRAATPWPLPLKCFW